MAEFLSSWLIGVGFAWSWILRLLRLRDLALCLGQMGLWGLQCLSREFIAIVSKL